MPRGKKFSAEQIIAKLREAEVLLAQGETVSQTCKQIGVTDQTHYGWNSFRQRVMKRLVKLQRWFHCWGQVALGSGHCLVTS